jgi:hypothetical protein
MDTMMMATMQKLLNFMVDSHIDKYNELRQMEKRLHIRAPEEDYYELSLFTSSRRAKSSLLPSSTHSSSLPASSSLLTTSPAKKSSRQNIKRATRYMLPPTATPISPPESPRGDLGSDSCSDSDNSSLEED